MEKVSIRALLAYYVPHAVTTNGKTTNPPPKHQWGYVMGGDGRVATDAYIMKRAKSSYPTQWEGYYNAYKKWIGFRVFDCNALAEAYYKEVTGVDINTKAKSNYASWCSVKSKAAKDSKLTGLPQMPGVAVFSGASAADISHVGFTLRKYGPGDLDWYVLECRGKDYGLVITTLKDRAWEWWGVMDKYFDYGEEAVPAPEKPPSAVVITLTSPLTRSPEIAALQAALNGLGYACGVADGIAGKNTLAGIRAFVEAHKEA